MRRWFLTVAVASAAVSLMAAGCGSDLDSNSEDGDAADDGGTVASNDDAEDKEGWPETIIHGILPTDDAEGLLATYEPLQTYMANCLDHPFEIVVGTSYTAMIEAMRTDNLHLSKMGPFNYILGHERAGAEALVQAVADPEEATYQSVIVTMTSHGFESLEDLEGETFAFTDPASTSGYLFPRAMMIDELGVDDDSLDSWFGAVTFSGGHTSSVLSVLNEDVAAASIASNNPVFFGEQDDHPRIDEFVVLAETEDIPISAEAIQGDLPESLKEAATECFVSVGDESNLAENPELEGFLERTAGGTSGFIPVDDSAYEVVRDTASALNMSPEDLLK